MTSLLEAPGTALRAVVSARGLSKSYGATPAVAELDLDLRAGRVMGFLGPNGAGKTTVLRLLTGALRPTAGSVRVLGHDPWSQAAVVHRSIGYLPGDLRLPARRTGREVLDLYDALRGGTGTWRDELVERLAAPLDTPVRALSKGNRQKLGIVQALMSRPPLLLLDEPTSGLDPLAQEAFDILVREAAADGVAVLLSSHVLTEVERVADEVAMLRSGRLVAVESLEVLRLAAPHLVVVRTGSAEVVDRLRLVDGVRDLVVSGDRVSLTATRSALDGVVKALATGVVSDVAITPADLDGLFLSYYEGGAGHAR